MSQDDQIPDVYRFDSSEPGFTTLIGDTFDIIIELTENKPVKVTELSVDACVKHKSKFDVRFFI